ncbi:glutathione transferase [Variovorax sp. J22R133]|uniref:glutathione transferase n=1 Tax=Variovorax brevis TaxID=3053503 RepID=UPI002575DD00|nr:glutathione transferase [Variovorax sp. J22R133]MDM0115103.1 glutathione transferase [Variovorax sp. J22R133]
MPQTKLLLHVDSQFTSPYAMSVFVALREKSLPFELATVDLEARAHEAPAYAATSLTRRVPTLIHDGFTLSESSAITEYIDEVFPATSVYPAGAQQRARARQVQAWLRSDLMPIRQERPTEVVFYGKKLAPLSVDAQAAAGKLFSFANALLPDASEHLFDRWCIADVDLALMLNRLAMHGEPVPEKLAVYARRQWERASVQEWVRQARPPL